MRRKVSRLENPSEVSKIVLVVDVAFNVDNCRMSGVGLDTSDLAVHVLFTDTDTVQAGKTAPRCCDLDVGVTVPLEPSELAEHDVLTLDTADRLEERLARQSAGTEDWP